MALTSSYADEAQFKDRFPEWENRLSRIELASQTARIEAALIQASGRWDAALRMGGFTTPVVVADLTPQGRQDQVGAALVDGTCLVAAKILGIAVADKGPAQASLVDAEAALLRIEQGEDMLGLGGTRAPALAFVAPETTVPWSPTSTGTAS